MAVRRLLFILALAVLVAAVAPHACAQDTYSWQVNYQHVILDIDKDGYVDMQYEIDAKIDEGVWEEVWIPETESNMKVNQVIDGNGKGHDFDVDDGQIKIKGFDLQPGDHVNLKIYSTLYEFVYEAKQNGYVITMFTPDWWDMTIRDTQVKYYLPGIVNTSELYTGKQAYSNVMEEDGRTAVYFQSTRLSPDQKFETSVSFPEKLMNPVVVSAAASAKATARPVAGTATTATPVPTAASCAGCLICLSPFILVGAVIFYLNGRRKPYASPVVSMAGIGINKDLDPVEAATLLRLDPRRILTMIMFGLMKKGNVMLAGTDPVRLDAVSGQGLNYYEKPFYDAIVNDRLDEDRLLSCFRTLESTVLDKTRPFSRKETEDYYRSKIDDAWKQIQAVDTPELKLQKYDTDMFWLMADEKFTQRTRDYVSRSPGSGTFYVPSYYWWYPYYYGTPYHNHYHTAASTITTPTGESFDTLTYNTPVGGKAPAASQPTNQATASVESFANSICDNVESMSTGVVAGVDRFVGVRNEVNSPPPRAIAPVARPAPAPSNFAGKSSCACVSCACACAHCACACACAGGGHGCT